MVRDLEQPVGIDGRQPWTHVRIRSVAASPSLGERNVAYAIRGQDVGEKTEVFVVKNILAKDVVIQADPPATHEHFVKFVVGEAATRQSMPDRGSNCIVVNDG
jgi:hypothetical protein